VRFGEDIGCKVNIIGQVLDQAKRQKVEQANGDDIKSLILELNNDSDCIGIVIQLPLPDYLQSHQQEFCDMIEPSKDIDCMTSRMLGRVAAGRSDVVYPAAVGATIEMLRFYALDNLKGKQVSIIGQSNLIGKPMALYCIGQ
jgi:methylenetetrahydrofolate dehydrogenase (NADP+)/methenyltetrahydrofolate cyclohydrolase